MTVPGSSPSPLAHRVVALFDASWAELHPLMRELLAAEAPHEVLDAAVDAWLERRGSGGATGTNALLAALAARQLGLRRGGEDAIAASVAALGFLHHAAGTAPTRRNLPAADAAETWRGWGDDALLIAALKRRDGERSTPDPILVQRACSNLVVRPKLRQVRGLLLAVSTSPSAAARDRVDAFLGPELVGGVDRSAKSSTAVPEAFDDALARACRLDPRLTMGHAIQIAAACEALIDRPDLAAPARAALLSSAATWPRLQRHWRAFLASSSA